MLMNLPLLDFFNNSLLFRWRIIGKSELCVNKKVALYLTYADRLLPV